MGMIDLTAEITAFVVSTGEPSTARCLALIAGQTVRVRTDVISNVTPMHAAFQAMIDRCETPYFVQVDADMMLNADAIETLYSRITGRPEALVSMRQWHTKPDYPPATGIGICVGWLWSDDVERPIMGVKIYDHARVKPHPFEQALSCEMGHNEVLMMDGSDVAGMPCPTSREGCLGLHYALQNPEMAFSRWQRNMQKHRKLPWMGWLGPYVEKLKAVHEEDTANPINRAAYQGAIAGLTGPVPDEEIDARAANQDFRRVEGYLGDWAKGPRELSVYVTERCNFKCSFCRRQKSPSDNPGPDIIGDGPLATGDLFVGYMMNELAKWPITSVCFAGFGEPLMHPDLPGLVAEAVRQEKTIGLITNGSLLTKALEWLPRYPWAYINVSLNAATAAEHKVITGTDTWDAVIEGIRAAVVIGLPVKLSFVVTRQKIHNIPDYLALAASLGVSGVYLHNLLPHHDEADKAETAAFWEAVIRGDDNLASRLLEDCRNYPHADLVEAWPQPIWRDADKGEPAGKCQSPFVSIGVNAQGHITGCRRVLPPDPAHSCGEKAANEANPWWGFHYTNLRRAVTGDAPCWPCTACFGNWRG